MVVSKASSQTSVNYARDAMRNDNAFIQTAVICRFLHLFHLFVLGFAVRIALLQPTTRGGGGGDVVKFGLLFFRFTCT